MAKKKKVDVPSDDAGMSVTAIAVRNALAEVEATYGAGIACSGSEYLDRPHQTISLGPAFDLALGGGIPTGKWVSVSGPEGCCKSATMMSFIANAQQDRFGGRPCMVLSAEHRMSEAILNGTRGLVKDHPMLTVIESTRGRILSSKDFLNIGLTFLKTVPGGILLIDSISALVSPKLIEDGLGMSDYGGGYKILSQFIDLAAPVVRAQDATVLGIAQVYANTSGRGAAWNIKASKHWKHQADLAIHCKKFEFVYADGEDQGATGQNQEWLVTKCAFARPSSKVTSTIRYGVGIDRAAELFSLAHGFGLITGSGWYTFDFLADAPELWPDPKGVPKVQGRDNCTSLLETNAAVAARLEQALSPYLSGEVA